MNQLLHRTDQALRRLCTIGLICLLATQLFLAPAWATSIYEVPDFEENSHVVDQAEVLSRSTEGHINGTFRDLEKSTGQEVYVVTIRRLDYEETIESFAQALFKRWFPDAADQKNVTLVAIDVLTDNSAVVSGEGAKARLTDEIAESVAKETILVPLKYGNRYNQAFNDATDRIAAVLSGQEDPGPPEVKDTVNVESTFASPEETEESNATVWVIVLLVLATAIPMATYYLYVYLGNR